MDKKIKKIIFSCCIVLGVIFLGGCFNTLDSAETSMFQIIEDNNQLGCKIIYNKKTKVMYSISNGYDNTGTMTILLNPDGTPMLYEE